MRSRYECQLGGGIGSIPGRRSSRWGLAPHPSPTSPGACATLAALGSAFNHVGREGSCSVPHSPCRRGQGPLPPFLSRAAPRGKSVQFHTDAYGFPATIPLANTLSHQPTEAGKGVPSSGCTNAAQDCSRKVNQPHDKCSYPPYATFVTLFKTRLVFLGLLAEGS